MSKSAGQYQPNPAERGSPSRRLSDGSRSAGRRRSQRLRAATALFAVHLVGAPLLLGGVYAWGMVITAASSIVCLAAAVAARWPLRTRTPAVVWVSLLLLAWTALQAMPLPCALVRALAPGAAEAASLAQSAMRAAPPAWCSLSYDPGATQEEVVKGIALVAALFTAWILSAGSSRRDVMWIVAGSSVIMSCVALAHAALRVDAVFGVYHPVEAHSPILLAPLLNANNLGGFAAMGAPLWIGLTHRHARSEMRWWGRIAAILSTLAAVLSLSRGAIAQVLGTLLFLAVYLYARSRRSRRTETRNFAAGLVVPATVAIAIALAAYIAGGQVAQEFERGDLNKLALLGRAFAFVAEHPWIGVGRGAFSSVFVSLAGSEVRFGHAENFIAQWASEWGVPLTLLWLATVVIALVRRLRVAKSLAVIGAATALLGWCGQNLVDLGFELVGVSTVAIALLGAILSPTELREKSPELQRLPARVALGFAFIACLAGLIALGPKLHAHSVPALEHHLRSTLRSRDRAGFRRTLETAVVLHPTEPLFAVIAATEALANADPNTARWLNRAMQVAPHWGAPHALAFEWLWRQRRRGQALLELRLAAERDRSRELLAPQFCPLAKTHPDLALEAMPRGPHRRAVLEMATECVSRETGASQLLDAQLLREYPDSPAASERVAYRAALAGDVDAALETLDVVRRRHPEWESASVTRAEVLLRSERYADLIREVDRELDRISPAHRASLLSVQASAYAKLGDTEGMQRALGAYRQFAGTSAIQLAETYALEGQLQIQSENYGAALTAFHEAYRINNETKYAEAVAVTARRLGNRAQELWAYMQLCDRAPVGTTYCSDRDRLLAPGSF